MVIPNISDPLVKLGGRERVVVSKTILPLGADPSELSCIGMPGSPGVDPFLHEQLLEKMRVRKGLCLRIFKWDAAI